LTFFKDVEPRPRSGTQKPEIDAPAAEAIAVQALAFIAGDEILLKRFLALTGLDPQEMRRAANEPGFLPGVLDFILGHEPTLAAFCDATQIPPSSVPAARRALGGPSEVENW